MTDGLIVAEMDEIEDLLKAYSLDRVQLASIFRFYGLLKAGNEVQNLTKLISPRDFALGHVVDCVELERSGLLGSVCMDLGSGCGVPGLLSAAIFGTRKWILSESETHKADFLRVTTEQMGLTDRVSVWSGRGEEYLRESSVDTVVSRAVGTVEKILAWIFPCSTWNNLVLLKGPGWSTESAGLSLSSYRKKVVARVVVEYRVPDFRDSCVIVDVKRAK